MPMALMNVKNIFERLSVNDNLPNVSIVHFCCTKKRIVPIISILAILLIINLLPILILSNISGNKLVN